MREDIGDLKNQTTAEYLAISQLESTSGSNARKVTAEGRGLIDRVA